MVKHLLSYLFLIYSFLDFFVLSKIKSVQKHEWGQEEMIITC